MGKLKLKEASIAQSALNPNIDVIEDISYVQEPDFSILDITVIPDNEYNPTIQSILIGLDENQSLNEAEKLNLGFNILSETSNEKTGYSHSLFEFESKNSTITLNLSLQESTKYQGVYTVSAYTTKGEKVFESNTTRPKEVICNYLNSLSSQYLSESSVIDSKDGELKTRTATIYQIREPRECGYGFMPYKYAEGKLNLEDYDKVATINITSKEGLENIFNYGNTDKSKFNIIKPMRSVSVSDIIELDDKKYYVDSFGFKEVV